MPRPLRPGRPARGRRQHTKPRPRSLHIGSHSAPRRPASRPGHARRPAHLQPLANACSTLAACCCCCRPAAPTPLAMAYAGLLKTRWGLASSIEITPSGHHEDCDLLAARGMRTPLPRVPPPDRVYVYSLESLKMFETLVTFEKPEYSFQLTPAFVQAIDAAEADAGNQQRHPSAAAPAPDGNGGSANAAPAPHGGAGQPGPP